MERVIYKLYGGEEDGNVKIMEILFPCLKKKVCLLDRWNGFFWISGSPELEAAQKGQTEF